MTRKSRRERRKPANWREVESAGASVGRDHQRQQAARHLRDREKRVMTLLTARYPNATNFQLRQMAKEPDKYLPPDDFVAAGA